MENKYNGFFGFDSYQDYLDSEHWKIFKEIVLDSRKNKEFWNGRWVKVPEWTCIKCNKKITNPQLHHTSYSCLGSERDEDIHIVCRKCHGDIHGK